MVFFRSKQSVTPFVSQKVVLHTHKMPFKQTIFTRNGSNPQAPTEEEVPTSLEGWDAVQAVGEGTAPFRAKSDDAAFIEAKLKSGAVPVAVKPDSVRSFFSRLHKYKKQSFRNWFYKARNKERVQGNGDGPAGDGDDFTVAAPTSGKAGVPGEVTVAAQSVVASFAGSKKRDYSTFVEEDDANSVITNSAFESAFTLPHFIAEWKTLDLDERLVVVVWMLSGAYKYWLKVVAKDVLRLRVAWPRSGSSAEALVRDYKEEKPGDKAIRLSALKYCMKAYQGKSGNLVKTDCFIKLPREVTDDEPRVKFSHMQSPTADLGKHFFCCNQNFFDRYMIIDLKCPTDKYEVEDNDEPAAFHFDEETDDELENDQLEEIRKIGMGARIITQMSP